MEFTLYKGNSDALRITEARRCNTCLLFGSINKRIDGTTSERYSGNEKFKGVFNLSDVKLDRLMNPSPQSL